MTTHTARLTLVARLLGVVTCRMDLNEKRQRFSIANAIPNLVSGSTGQPFQSPYATLPGGGLSPVSVNVLCGSTNLPFRGRLHRTLGSPALDGPAPHHGTAVASTGLRKGEPRSWAPQHIELVASI